MKHLIKEYFNFNKSEKRGVLVLLSIIVMLSIAIIALPHLISTKKYDFSSFEESYNKYISTNKTSITNDSAEYNEVDSKTIANEKFLFDPNTATLGEWKKLGLAEKQANTIKRYLEKGGKFYHKGDLKKIYGLSETLYNSIEPYIQINVSNADRTNISTKSSNYQIEINSADSAQLVSLKGVGPAFAKRIMNYRNKLGGFIYKDQLKEVYGLDSLLFNIISKQTRIDTTIVRKININSASFEELKNHPYIKSKTAKLIINYRNKHQSYQSIEDIKNIDIIKDSLYLKIKPYLTNK